MATIRIGTSGWSYPHWRGSFYPASLPADEWLPFYATHFGAVEINSTFYRLPSAKTVATWRDATPPGFTFTAKLSRFVTHMKKLKDPQQTLPPFLERIALLGAKLGPLVIQLPPNWNRNEARLAQFLRAAPQGQRFTVECRNNSWWTDGIFDLLRRDGVAACIFHLAGIWSPIIETADFIYIRLHGPDGAYSGCYDAAALQRIAGWCRDWRDRSIDVFVFFDNDEHAYAVKNALTLLEILQDPN